jgi:hypothetical protein
MRIRECNPPVVMSSSSFVTLLTHNSLHEVKHVKAMTAELNKLDQTLTQRIAVPMQLLKDDYTAVAGADGTAADDPACELDYRLWSTAWVGPWGSYVPWILPPSSVVGTTMVLRVPPSRVRHFLGSVDLYVKTINPEDVPRIVRAKLSLGAERTVQSFDSEFACRIAIIYKHNGEVAKHNYHEQSVTLDSPLFFSLPLRVLPLFIPNSPLPEIEYELSTSVASASFVTEFVSSPGESDIPPITAPPPDTPPPVKTVVQHLTSLTTFKSLEGTLDVHIVSPEGRLIRAIYIRVSNGEIYDMDNVIESIEIVGPPPRSVSLTGMAYPGKICRSLFKKRFANLMGPYYVIPFAISPGGHSADYGLLAPPDSRVVIKVFDRISIEGLSAEVCVETNERVVWKL